MPLQDVAFSRLGMRVGMLPRGCVIRNGLPMPVAAFLPADISLWLAGGPTLSMLMQSARRPRFPSFAAVGTALVAITA